MAPPAAAAAAALLLAGTVWAVNRPTGTAPVGGPTVATRVVGRHLPDVVGPVHEHALGVRDRASEHHDGHGQPDRAAGGPTDRAPDDRQPTLGDDGHPARLLPGARGGRQRAAATLPRVRADRRAGARHAGGQGPGRPAAGVRLHRRPPGAAGYASPWSLLRPDVGHRRRRADHGGAVPRPRRDPRRRRATWRSSRSCGRSRPRSGRERCPCASRCPGDAELAPGLSSTRTWNRPGRPASTSRRSSRRSGSTSPSAARSSRPGRPLTVKGVASTFEANVEWQLLTGGAVVDEGFTTATIGAPGRGTYTFETEPLTAGATRPPRLREQRQGRLRRRRAARVLHRPLRPPTPPVG